MKKPRLQKEVAALSVSGAGLRQIGRLLGASHSTVARQLARLARHCLLFQAQQLRDLEIEEPVVVDGFESFEYSQHFPFHLNLAAGQTSWFLYWFTDSPLRRKGRMTEEQRTRRQELESTLGRPDPKAVETGMAALIGFLVARSSRALELHSDEHPAYPRAIQQVRRTIAHERRFDLEHRRTSSKEARTPGNLLFAANLTDMLLRHCHANHRRETIAFSKCRQAAIERLAVFAIWRNWIKSRREKSPKHKDETAAMFIGLATRMLSWKDVLRRRLFPKHQDLPKPWPDYYWRKIRTAALGDRQNSHSCKFAI